MVLCEGLSVLKSKKFLQFFLNFSFFSKTLLLFPSSQESVLF